MPNPQLLAEIEKAIDAIFDGDLRAVVADTGGAALCWEASEELCDILGRGEVVYLSFTGRYIRGAGLLRKWMKCYFNLDGSVNDGGHAIVEVDGYFVDLTARQFHMRLPFPLIVPVTKP